MRRLLVLLGVLLAVPTAPASAQQTPAGCTSSRFGVDISWNPGKGRVGLPSTVSVAVSQSGAGACDVSDVTIDLQLPGADGAPSATLTRLVTGATYAHDMGSVTLPGVPWTVALDPGVTTATARVSVSGTLRDSTGGSPFTLFKTISHPIVAPRLGLAVTAEPATGAAPLDVTYRFALTNLGTPPEPLSAVKLAHPFCAPVYASGDANADNALDDGETWLYACTHRFATGGDHVSTTNAVATSTSDGRRVDASSVDTLVRLDAPSALGQLTLTTVATPAGGFAPLDVTYTYTVRNDGTGAVGDVTVADGGCSPVTTTAGNTPLAPGATRTFTCTRLLGTAGTFTAGALASGIDVTSGRRVSSATITSEVTTTEVPAPVATVRPAATATPTPRPAATISTLAGKRKVAGKTRKVTIATVACPTGATCSITAPKTTKLKLGGRTYSLAVTAPKTLAGGKRSNVTLTLSSAAYARLKSGRVSVRLTAKATGASTTSLTVKAAIKR
jgi:hypothetical protein